MLIEGIECGQSCKEKSGGDKRRAVPQKTLPM
jgi:hypothetical protein